MSATRRRNGDTWWGVAPMLTIHTQEPIIDQSAARVFITSINIMDQRPSFDDRTQILMKLHAGDTLWDKTANLIYTSQTLPQDSGYLSEHHIRWDSTDSNFKLPYGLEVPHDQNSFNFAFTNSNVKSRDKIVYRYILEGIDSDWSAASDVPNTRNYYNIPPGRYTFKVASSGFNQIWSEPATITFTIRPPWWQTWWAYVLFLVGFVAVVFTIVQYRSRWLKRENRILEERVSHRTAQLKKTIEELKTTQDQLIQSEKMASLGELTAGIAHEIQNPLNFVNNFSQLNRELLAEMSAEIENGNLEEAKAIAESIASNEEKIDHHGKRADAIVKGMLQHSRSHTGVKEKTDINALCDEYLRLAYHGFKAKDKSKSGGQASFNATFETNFDPTLPNINAVPQDIGRVLLNLINNAFYAVIEKSKTSSNGYLPLVSLSTKNIGYKVEIVVRDNGNGIPDDIKEKIFQPFFTTKPTGQGTGLGLSLSYDIVKGHGGTMEVSASAAVGAQFTITLPINL
jgi:signal transduction histidine kinase